MAAASEMYQRAAWTIAFALVLYYINHQEYPGPTVTLVAVIVLIGLGFAGAGYGISWLAGPGRTRVLEQVLDSLELQGSERILDAGSADGQLGLAAARRLKSGKVIALGDTATNEVLREAAKNEGLGDRIRFESGDWKKLAYTDGSFECVIGSQVLARLDTDVQRTQAIQEMLRVLKPGGHLALHEVSDFGFVIQTLERASASSPRVVSTSLPLGLGGRVITARKPA